MELSEFYSLMDGPDKISSEHLASLSELSAKYPYFSACRKMYLKALQNSNNIHFGTELQKSLYSAGDLRQLYFYLYPDMKIDDTRNSPREEKYTGSYFDLLEKADGGRGGSLKALAEKLKKARAMVSPEEEPLVDKERIEIPVNDYFRIEEESTKLQDVSEENYKALLKLKKYAEALEILKQLNLINPKKSVYFADQIRFLEKVIKIQHNS